MKIGELAIQTGTSVATLRFYEQQGLLQSQRTPSNYRHFPESALTRVQQIKRYRALNLSLPEVKRMLHWAQAPQDNCAEVCQLMRRRLQQVVEQKELLTQLESELERLLSSCSGQGGPDGCQILKQLDPLPPQENPASSPKSQR